MIFEFNLITLDTVRYRLSLAGNNVAIEPQVFDLLVYLIENRNRVVTRAELLENLWIGKVVTDAALGVRLKNVRKAVGDSGNKQEVIKTFHGRGYQFIADVTFPANSIKDAVYVTAQHHFPQDKPSIAVLQFQDMSKDADNDFFVDGVTEEILTCLCRYREIVVTALGSSVLVSEQKLDVREATKRLGVQYALSGSVRKSGDRVRITASLIEGETGHQIWSEQYDRELSDIFMVQDEVAQRIVTMLAGEIERSDRERSLRKETDNLSAYECVLHGRYYFHDWHGSQDDVLRAREMFEQAIKLDPRYSSAYAGLAATYLEDFDHGWSGSPETTGVKCLELAQKAIELDERDSYAHMVLSSAYWRVKYNFKLAKSQLETAIELNPNYYWNYCYGCWLSTCAGDLDDSVAQANEAIRRNPLLPDECLWSLGFTEYLAERYENAISTISQIAKPEPESYACLIACYAQLGCVEEGRKATEEFHSHSGIDTMSEEDWRFYWGNYLKFKDQSSLDHLIDGLDKAGLVTH